jgi:hypothetical protein
MQTNATHANQCKPTQTHANTRKPMQTHANPRKHTQTHANQRKARDVTYLTDFNPKTRDAKHLMFSVLQIAGQNIQIAGQNNLGYL